MVKTKAIVIKFRNYLEIPTIIFNLILPCKVKEIQWDKKMLMMWLKTKRTQVKNTRMNKKSSKMARHTYTHIHRDVHTNMYTKK